MGQQFSVSFSFWLWLLLFSFFEPNKTPPSVHYINTFFVFKPFVWRKMEKTGQFFSEQIFFVKLFFAGEAFLPTKKIFLLYH